MKSLKALFITALLCCLTAYISFAQDSEETGPVQSEVSKAYHEFKLADNKCYSSAKVDKLIEKDPKYATIHNVADDDSDDKYRGVTQDQLNKFTVKELLIYCALYPESFSQICDGYIPIPDEEKKILPYLSDNYDEFSLSQRQKKALLKKRTAIVKLITDCSEKEKHVGNVYKQLLSDMNATESIPSLIKIYNSSTQKDSDILTLLMLFMLENKDKNFMKSEFYKTFYSDDASTYESYVELNEKNEKLILKQAAAFHATHK